MRPRRGDVVTPKPPFLAIEPAVTPDYTPHVVQVDFFPFRKMSETETRQLVADFKKAHGDEVFVVVHAVVEHRPVVDFATVAARLAVRSEWLYRVGWPPFSRVVRARTPRSSLEPGHPTCIGTVEIP